MTATATMTATAAQQPPTVDQFGRYQRAFDWFNRELFDGSLPGCMLNFSRLSKSRGFFAPQAWQQGKGDAAIVAHEISLNPDAFGIRTAKEILSTLVHEMAHLWQQVHGTPPRRCYHDREWADKMEAIGLVPSATGEPGGKRTGAKMTHWIDPNGKYSEAFDAMPNDYLLPWSTPIRPPAEEKERKAKRKHKFACPGCDAQAWGKPGLSLVCGECRETMADQDADADQGDDSDDA